MIFRIGRMTHLPVFLMGIFYSRRKDSGNSYRISIRRLSYGEWTSHTDAGFAVPENPVGPGNLIRKGH